MKSKIKKILIISGIIILVVGVLTLIAWQKTKEEFQSLSGKVMDVLSKEALANIDIEVNGQKTKTNEKGEFYFEKVSKNNQILIKGLGIFREIIIPIAKRKYIEINVDTSLFNLFIYLEKYERDRQYRKTYQAFHSDVKSIYSEEKYLAEKNAWRDEKTNQGLKVLKPEFKTEIKNLENWRSDFTKKSYQNVIETTLINNFQDIQTKQIKKEEKKVYFIKENNNWFWLYQPI